MSMRPTSFAICANLYHCHSVSSLASWPVSKWPRRWMEVPYHYALFIFIHL